MVDLSSATLTVHGRLLGSRHGVQSIAVTIHPSTCGFHIFKSTLKKLWESSSPIIVIILYYQHHLLDRFLKRQMYSYYICKTIKVIQQVSFDCHSWSLTTFSTRFMYYGVIHHWSSICISSEIKQIVTYTYQSVMISVWYEIIVVAPSIVFLIMVYCPECMK